MLDLLGLLDICHKAQEAGIEPPHISPLDLNSPDEADAGPQADPFQNSLKARLKQSNMEKLQSLRAQAEKLLLMIRQCEDEKRLTAEAELSKTLAAENHLQHHAPEDIPA